MLKLSIIIPVYNVEKYLPSCLDSVIYPELSGYEIIIVNDGSPDSSPAIAEEYRKKHPGLIQLISTPNGGIGHARNTGTAAAHGEYILYLDSDDYLVPGAVGEILELLNERNDDIFIFDFRAVSEKGEVLKHYLGCEADGAVTLANCPSLLNSMPNAWNKICRRCLFADTGIVFPDRVWYEDLCTMPKLYLHTESIFCVHKIWYNYLQRSGSITKNTNEKRNLEIIPAVDAVIEYYRSHGCFEKYRSELEFMAFYNQYLTASTRVALMNSSSPVLDELRSDFLSKFPDFEKNRLVRTMPKKWALLSKLIFMRRYRLVALIMSLNNRLRGK